MYVNVGVGVMAARINNAMRGSSLHFGCCSFFLFFLHLVEIRGPAALRSHNAHTRGCQTQTESKISNIFPASLISATCTILTTCTKNTEEEKRHNHRNYDDVLECHNHGELISFVCLFDEI